MYFCFIFIFVVWKSSAITLTLISDYILELSKVNVICRFNICKDYTLALLLNRDSSTLSLMGSNLEDIYDAVNGQQSICIS